jgi:glycolate oxidase FAD binding subunit
VDETTSIDDFGPLPVAQPHAVADLGDLVRAASAQGRAVYPLGGRTAFRFGLPPSKAGVAVDLRQLDQVIDYPARDMTITVQAGVTIDRLQRILAVENQRLPVDVPLADRATLGGAVATNASGPRRLGFGALRDYVIGISVVNDEGHETKAGGRVVKNVAGYDLCKLYTGSFGTLGVITQLTLKVRPRPERSLLLRRTCRADELSGLLAVLHTSRTRPACVTVVNTAAALALPRLEGESVFSSGWQLFVGYEDNRTAVAWQVDQLQRETSSLGSPIWKPWPADGTADLWRSLTDFPLAAPAELTVKANLLPGGVADFCARADNLPERLALQAHAGSGIVVAHVRGGLTLDRARVIVNTLLDAAAAAGGNMVLLRCPTAWKADLPVWGRPRGDLALMRQVKQRLDPRGVFNPGRFVGGL